MADKNRHEKLLLFYSECQRKGINDMDDFTQSAEARGLAKELGLDYEKIKATYEDARKAAAYKEYLYNKEGTLLFTGFGTSDYKGAKSRLELYVCEDGNYFAVVDEERYFGNPEFRTNQIALSHTVYTNPSTSYFGVSDGSISSGAAINNPGGINIVPEKVDRGQIILTIKKTDFHIGAVIPSKKLAEAFKRDSTFQKYYNGEALIFETIKGSFEEVARRGSRNINDVYMLAYLPLTECNEVISLLKRMVNNELPPSDKEYYDKAVKLSSSKTLGDVKEAIDIFKRISDYQDAKNKAELVRKHYDEMVQLKKEETKLKAEKKAKNTKTVAIVGVILGVLAVIGLVVWVMATS